ncbi:MAG: tol-pal system YbgF family protein [Saprospiraceae bacterium]
MGRILLNDMYKTSHCLTNAEIRSYLHGHAPTSARRRVEEHLLDCPLCSDAVEGFEAAPANVALPEDFSAFRKKLPGAGEGQVRRLRPGRVLLRVAAVAAILLATYFILFQSTSPADLYTQYYTSYRLDIPMDMRSSDKSPALSPTLLNALQRYGNAQYEASIPVFEEVLKSDPGNEAARFFAGIACLETGQFEKAARFLTTVQKGTGIYAGKAAWYLALADLQAGDISAAKVLLKEIKAGNGYKKPEAAALLREL